MEFRMNEVLRIPLNGPRDRRGENIDEKLRKSSLQKQDKGRNL
jgi:hypothetical protein